jgi:hypothetical protein
MFKKIIGIVFVVFIIGVLCLSVIPISANTNTSQYKIGDTKVLPSGDIATVVGFTKDGSVEWNVHLGIMKSDQQITNPNYTITNNYTTSASDGFISETGGIMGGFAPNPATAWSTAYNGTGTDSGGALTLTAFTANPTNQVKMSTLETGAGAAISSISKSYLYFNTTALISGVTINSASLNLYCTAYSATVSSWSMGVYQNMNTYPHDPLVAGDYYQTIYGTTNGGTWPSSSMTASANNSISLNATGLTWINKGGITKFALIDATNTAVNSQPTYIADSVLRSNYFVFNSSEAGSNQPYLSVTFTAISPTISSSAVSNLANTTAQLNANVTSDGGDTAACQVSWGYGTTSQTAANFASYDHVTAFAGTYSTGENPFYSASSLLANTTYYYRVQIKNSAGTTTSATEQTFTTYNTLSYITNFNGTPTNDQISLNWVKATGSSSTYIYRQNTPFVSATPTLTNGTGTATGSPVTLVNGSNTITVTGAGTFYALGVYGTATSGGATLSGSPVTLDGGYDLLDTGATTGTFTIDVTYINPNPNIIYNPSFEVGTPPTGWTATGAGATFTRSNTQVKVGTYSGSLVRSGADCTIYSVIPTYASYASKSVTLGMWVYATVASRARITINDGVGTTSSSYHSGTAGWEWLTVTRTIDASPTKLWAVGEINTDDTTAYFDWAVLNQGSALPSTGTLIYSDTASTFEDVSLTVGTTYYYSGFGYSSGIWSPSPVYLTLTTAGANSTPSGGNAVPTPVLPASFYQDPDTSASSPMSNLEPIYSLVKDAATSLGMTTPEQIGTLWVVIALAIVAVIGMVILIGTKSVTGALFVMCVIISIFCGFKVLPWEYIALLIPCGLGVWATRKGEGNSL